MLAPLVEKGVKNGKPMELEIGIIANTDFNAFAYTGYEVDLIAINIGAINRIIHFYRCIFSHNENWPEYGENHTDQVPLFVQSDTTSPLLSLQREQSSHTFIQTSVLYMIFHEFAHIYNGHADWVYRVSGHPLQEIFERQSEEVSFEDWQTLEWDADQFAVYQLLVQTLTPEVDFSTRPTKWRLLNNNALGDTKSIVKLVSSVVLTCHFIMAALDNNPINNANGRRHPPEYARQYYAFGAIPLNLDARTELGWDTGNELANAGAIEAIKAWARIFQVSPVHPFYEDNIDFSADLISIYIKRWRKLYPALNKLKRGGELASPQN